MILFTYLFICLFVFNFLQKKKKKKLKKFSQNLKMESEPMSQPAKQFSDVRLLNDEIIGIQDTYLIQSRELDYNIKENTERFLMPDN